MTRRVTQIIALAAGAVVLWVPPGAWGSPDAVVRDCAADGSLDGSYSDDDKRAALGQLGAELGEYSDCRSVISAAIGRNAQARSSSSPEGGPAGEASVDESAKDEAAKRDADERRRAAAAKAEKAEQAARERRAGEVALGGRSIEADEAGALTSEDTGGGGPPPIGLALIALGLIAGMFALSRRLRVAEAIRRARFRR